MRKIVFVVLVLAAIVILGFVFGRQASAQTTTIGGWDTSGVFNRLTIGSSHAATHPAGSAMLSARNNPGQPGDTAAHGIHVVKRTTAANASSHGGGVTWGAFVQHRIETPISGGAEGVLGHVVKHAAVGGDTVAVNGVLHYYTPEAAGANFGGHFQVKDATGAEGRDVGSMVASELSINASGRDHPTAYGLRRGASIKAKVYGRYGTSAEVGTGVHVGNSARRQSDGRLLTGYFRHGAVIEDRTARQKGSPHVIRHGVLIDTAGNNGLRVQGPAVAQIRLMQVGTERPGKGIHINADYHGAAILIHGQPRYAMDVSGLPIRLGRNSRGEPVTMQLVGDEVVVTGATVVTGAP